MIQAIGLTSNRPRGRLTGPARWGRRVGAHEGDPALVLDDVSLEAHPGRVTALLGAPASGKTTALRLMLELDQGRGITYFRGRPLHRIPHPAHEVGVLLGEVPGHPGRSVRGHLRMLCAAAGVSTSRADEVLEDMGLVSLRGEPLGTLSRGLDRRLGMACALLTDPHTLVLDAPSQGLAPREARWLHDLLRAHADGGGTVLFSTDDPKEAARSADRVVTLDAGRVVADQEAVDFARTRLRPRIAVRSPYAARLGLLLAKEARAARRSVEVVREDGTRLSVYGSTCADIGETAFRHGILVHQLAEEIGDMGPGTRQREPEKPAQLAAPAPEAVGGALVGSGVPSAGAGPLTARAPDGPAADRPAREQDGVRPSVQEDEETRGDSHADTEPRTAPPGESLPRTAPPGKDSEAPVSHVPGPRPRSRGPDPSGTGALPPPIAVRAPGSPLSPVRYELHRATGVATAYVTAACVLVSSALLSLLLAGTGRIPPPYVLAGWPRELPLPPAALGAGLLGALAFGDEFRHPALAADHGTVPRRLGMLGAKLLVAAASAVLFAVATFTFDAAVLHLVYGFAVDGNPVDWPSLGVSWISFVVGCAWAGVLAAGVFRSTAAGLAAVLAVPLVVVPLVHAAVAGAPVRGATGFPAWLREFVLGRWPLGAAPYTAAGATSVAQPLGGALVLSLGALLCGYMFSRLRGRAR
ncbi:ABC transporter ATP-binding protein [Streptomyces sp. TS71-3]|uniref:ATP-binding cassette domain-containing protein n=1 Tax=Streptomyces sp. TS71-3 TaxID=2733862 RepID=UPI001B14BC55|nr:ABC transporter ATP-binding protein [Streptomyces sp. TS71-3]GHJ40615.1 ABC transporter [Streptomyces sp. TS71-3]